MKVSLESIKVKRDGKPETTYTVIYYDSKRFERQTMEVNQIVGELLQSAFAQGEKSIRDAIREALGIDSRS